MIRKFCDICKTEIDNKSDIKFHGENFPFTATIKHKASGAEVHLVVYKETINDGLDLCKYCVIDAFNELDDRTKDGHS